MRPYNPYNPYDTYIAGYNPCVQAAGYSVYQQQPATSNNPNMMPVMPNMPNMMPTPMPGLSGDVAAGLCPPGTVPYAVQEGDTLYSIARLHGVTIQDILAVNPSITDANMIFIGQIICVPGHMPPITCPPGSMPYTVMQGDTLTTIADRFSVSVYSLTVANPGFNPENLMPGMRLCIAPFACMPACVEKERYTLSAGEDLESVAKKFRVTTDDLLKANPFYPPCKFVCGTSICLPAHCAEAEEENEPPKKKD